MKGLMHRDGYYDLGGLIPEPRWIGDGIDWDAPLLAWFRDVYFKPEAVIEYAKLIMRTIALVDFVTAWRN
jgi:hypothetical protein